MSNGNIGQVSRRPSEQIKSTHSFIFPHREPSHLGMHTHFDSKFKIRKRKMPSCFGRNSMFDQEADLPRKEKKKKTKQKAKSFTEAILVSARKGNNDDSVAPSSLYDPYRTGNTECPLPLPLPFYSSDSSARSRNSTSSISSISNYDEEIIITTSAPKLSLMQWGVSCESSPNHPRHPLPLPPTSPTKTCHHDSKWKKGRLLGRGTFGHVYAGFNRYIIIIYMFKKLKKTGLLKVYSFV